MSRWYRAYEGTVTDAKLAEAASIAGCSRSVAIATWHAILENAATLNDGGRIDIPSRRVAAVLVEPLDIIETLFAAFETIGLIDDSHVSAWKRRQYESDSSTERSRKHRNIKRNADATLQQQHATPPETETETEKNTHEGGATRISPSWKPTEADKQFAMLRGITSLDEEVGRFVDHYRSKATLSADWSAQFRNWCRHPIRERERYERQQRGQPGKRGQGGNSIVKAGHKLLAQLRQSEESELRDGAGDADVRLLPQG